MGSRLEKVMTGRYKCAMTVQHATLSACFASVCGRVFLGCRGLLLSSCRAGLPRAWARAQAGGVSPAVLPVSLSPVMMTRCGRAGGDAVPVRGPLHAPVSHSCCRRPCAYAGYRKPVARPPDALLKRTSAGCHGEVHAFTDQATDNRLSTVTARLTV